MEALVLASGPLFPTADELLQQALSPFVHEVVKMERIDLGGRTIVGLLIRIDQAHFDAILKELEAACSGVGLDVAMELI
jgi:hypothetical protein